MDPISPGRRVATELASVKTSTKYLHERINDLHSRLVRVERSVWAVGGGLVLLQFLRGCF